jgi:hypothetical protein
LRQTLGYCGQYVLGLLFTFAVDHCIIGVSLKWSVGMIFLHSFVEGVMHKQIR